MGNSAEAPYGITQPGAYYDVVPRVLRNVVSYQFTQPITSTVTVATANAIPQITQGTEIMAFNYNAVSLQSLIEIEINSNITTVGGGPVFWVALFADYSPDALAVFAGGGHIATIPNTVYLKHYFNPVTLVPVRYSFRMAPAAQTIVANYYSYGGRTQSRVTVKEWSGLSLGNVAP